ncbi:VWA domain-containing protein [Methylophilaceae bacterium]|jgi:mxaL protein|nr:VWA domain-containing protein [Methylophilaceae bacterium]MDC0542529.1 VWA domain-containing protein [Methylophilaceae bacterium]|tara:strand:- start:512 stop:1483 length:972 start_codon:yes stop_codon:yes gene_type:complete
MKQLLYKIIGDKNISFLCLSIVFLILGLINPKVSIERDIHNYIFVVDISQSMLTKDMSIEGQKVSRLDYSKKLLQGIMDQLPCKTNVSIGMFAGVSVAATYTPINICDNYSAINSTIQHLDWRSVWSGNSRIREGLSNLARLIRSFPQSARVVFLTDGEEAPRLHTFNTRDLSQFQGETDWLMVGIGSEEGSAIPKYDSENQLIGFWSIDSFALQPGIAQISESNIGARNDSIAFSESDRYISKLNEKYLIEITSMIKGQYIKGDSVNSVVSKMNTIPPSWRDNSELPLRNLFVTLSLVFFLLRFNKLLPTISFLKKKKKTIA